MQHFTYYCVYNKMQYTPVHVKLLSLPSIGTENHFTFLHSTWLDFVSGIFFYICFSTWCVCWWCIFGLCFLVVHENALFVSTLDGGVKTKQGCLQIVQLFIFTYKYTGIPKASQGQYFLQCQVCFQSISLGNPLNQLNTLENGQLGTKIVQIGPVVQKLGPFFAYLEKYQL